MPLTGFYFIQMFFVSSNVAANNILQTYRPKKKKETHDQLSVAQSDGKAKLLELIGEIQSSI